MAVVLGTSSGFVTSAPVADPAGGNTTIDGSSVVTKHTSPNGAVKITEIGWYRGSGTNTANFEVALYADSSGAAGSRLYVDATNSSSASGWITVAVDWSIAGNTDYWLGLQMDSHTGSSTVDNATSGGAGSDVRTTQTTLNDPYGGGTVADADGMYAIYALVTIQLGADERSVKITGFDLANAERPTKIRGGYAQTVADDFSTADNKDAVLTTAVWAGDGIITL